MPDWFAHLMLATITSTCLRLDPWKRTIFFIGNVMPDLVRILVILDNVIHWEAFNIFVALPINVGSHSLLGLFAYSLFVSLFFEPALPDLQGTRGLQARVVENTGTSIKTKLVWWWHDATGRPFFLLFLGGIFHLLLDTFMWPFGSGVMWLYPLNSAWFVWSFGAWWPSTFDGILWLAPFFVAAIGVEIAILVKRKHARGGWP